MVLNLDHMLNAVAYCQVVFEAGRPVDWIHLSTNRAFHTQTGLGPVVGKRASEAIPGIHVADPHLLELYGQVAATGTAARFETFVASLNAWFSVQAYCPALGYFVAFFDVVTAGKRRETDLKSAQERLSLAQRASHSGIWDWNIPAGTLYWSDEFMELFGLEAAATTPSFDIWRRTLHPDDLGPAEERVLAAVKDHRPLFNEYRIVLPTGGIRWIRAYGDTIYDDHGRPLRMIGICLDVTEAKSLAEAAASADAASRAKSEFLATMSHELRTPLNSVIGFSALMLDGLSGEFTAEQRHQLAIIKRSGEQLLEMVSEVLNMARIEAGKLEIESGPVDLSALVREQCDLMRVQATERGLDLVYCDSGQETVVLADGKRVRQVLRNLVSNAIKFTDQGSIRVSVDASDGMAKVTVVDSGIGIPRAEQSKLFVPFGRVQRPGERERYGTGLGLVISRRLVQAMAGEIGLVSEAHAGSTFWFTLPLRQETTLAGARD
jgi:PAS domain S-box-containing protein